MNLKSKKIRLLFYPVMAAIIFLIDSDMRRVEIFLPVAGMLMFMLPAYLENFFSDYKKINNYQMINKFFHYSGSGLVLFLGLEVIYEIITKG